MSNDFSLILDNAIKICDGMFLNTIESEKGFQKIYPFTTENIAGYINEFDLKNKSLLTVGSSSDQVLNAILYGCRDITLLDINPFAKCFYYLKIASMLELDMEEYLRFLRFRDFISVFRDNMDVFNIYTFNKIKDTLRLLDYESYLFWDELFQMYKPLEVRDNLFEFEENRSSVIAGSNSYLMNKEVYNETKEKILETNINFVNSDIFKVQLDRTFDNIWLSNIGTYLKDYEIRIMIDKMMKYLNKDGKMLASYLYSTVRDTKYDDEWMPIYNLDKVFEDLKEYNINLVSFLGINGIKFNDKNVKDSIIICKKKNLKR